MKHDRNHHSVDRPREIGALLTRYRASGLTLKDFAREHDLPPGRLHYWLYQKHRAGVPRASAWRPPPAPAPVFQEVTLAGCAPLDPNWAAEVSLPRGMAVRFHPAAQPGWIGAVVQALQRPC